MQDIPLTLAGLKQAILDLWDDYSSHLHDGTSTRTFQTIRAEAASLRALSIQKIGYADTTPGLWTGVSAAGVPQFNLGTASKYIKFDGVNFSILGALSVSQLDIPDQTTANSFHVDSSGNTWWGANVASGISGANAAVTAAGAATFKNVAVGGTTIQYVITNSGIFSFGDGSDGTATCDGSTAVTGMSLSGSTYTMTKDVYFTSLTINFGVTVKPAGYRIFVSNTLTLNGTIQGNGNNAGDGTDGQPGIGPAGGALGAALADGYLKGSVSGNTGGAGASTDGGYSTTPGGGSNGSNTTNSIGGNGIGGGKGGDGNNTGQGGTTNGGAAGTGGTATVSNVKLIANWHLATLLDVSSTGSTVKFNNSAGSGSGGGGGWGGGTGAKGGGGGGSGSGGRILAIYVRNIVFGASGLISSNGGNGGKGGNGQVVTEGGGGGGGGAGGNGGVIILTYNNSTNMTLNTNVTVTGGTKGAKGTGGAGSHSTGTDGTAGSDGSAGVIYQFQLSL